MTMTAQDIFHSVDFETFDDQGLNVLLVDDSPLQQQVLTFFLKQLGHRVILASDGCQAIYETQYSKTIDLILMDCVMPIMDGFQATRLIRQAEIKTGNHIAIIGTSSTALAEECFAAGMDDFLHKPLNKMILKAILGNWNRQKRSFRDRRHIAVL